MTGKAALRTQLRRWNAAIALQQATDRLVLLQACERATGRAWVRVADLKADTDAAARWAVVRGDAGPRQKLAAARTERFAL